MSEKLPEPVAFATNAPQTNAPHKPPSPERRGAPVELIATLLLALSILIAVTAVSIGIARADTTVGGACSLPEQRVQLRDVKIPASHAGR